MSIFDRVGKIAERVGELVTDRVGGFVEDTLIPPGARGRLLLAEAALKDGKLDEAIEHLDVVDAMRGGLVRVKFLRGVIDLERGRHNRAIHHLEHAARQREGVETYYFLGLAYELAKRYSDARNALLASLRIEKDPPLLYEILLALGRVYLAMGRADKASRELRRALQVKPAAIEALTLLAAALRRLDEVDEAAQLLHAQRELLVDPDAWLLLAQLDLARGDDVSASAAFQEVLNLVPEHLEALFGAAQSALQGHKLGQAQELIGRLLSREGESARVSVLRGQLARAHERFDEALDHFEDALEHSPTALEPLIGAGQMRLQRGEHATAERLFERALSLAPEEPRAILGTGRARLGLGNRSGALRLLEQARSMHPAIDVLLVLGDLARVADEHLRALVYYQEAASLDPARPDVQRGVLEMRQAVRPHLVPPTDASPIALRRHLEALRDHVAGESLLQHALAPLSEMLVDFDNPLRIAILGEFNAGKSTLINAFLGEPVVPTGILPTTATVNVIRYGPRKIARIYTEGIHEEVDYTEVRDRIEALGERVDHIDFLYPHPELRSVHFIDTPGFNASVDAHEAIAASALDEADAVLWLVDANQALSESQRAILEKIENGPEKILVVLNKIDQLDTDEQDELLAYLEKGLNDLTRSVHAISALEAFRARHQAHREGNADDLWSRHSNPALAAARWPALIEALNTGILERSQRLKAFELERRATHLARGIVEQADRGEKRFVLLIEQMKAGREALDRAAQRFRDREVYEECGLLREQQDVVLSAVAREVDDARRPSGGWLSPLTLGRDDLGFLLGLLRERTQRNLERSRERVLRAVSEPVEATLQTLEWIAKALEPSQSQLMLRRLESFVAEERMLRLLLEERVFARQRVFLEGRIQASLVEGTLAEELGADDPNSAQRKLLLGRVLGDVTEIIGEGLRSWSQEYFDATLRLCDNVQRDIEQMRLELVFRVRQPFEALVQEEKS